MTVTMTVTVVVMVAVTAVTVATAAAKQARQSGTFHQVTTTFKTVVIIILPIVAEIVHLVTGG